MRPGLSLGILLAALLTGCGGGTGDNASGSGVGGQEGGLARPAVGARQDGAGVSIASGDRATGLPLPGETVLGPAATVGKMIFHDASLSASGRMSCATCHDTANAHAPANDLAVQFGGPLLDRPGVRSVPSLRYLDRIPAFGFDGEGTASGGLNRDGRADSLAAQALRPFLAPHEMANDSIADLVRRLRAARFAPVLQRLHGRDLFDRPDDAFAAVGAALAAYQTEDPQFHPYSSRYDAWLAGRARLDAAELRGLALFNDPAKGNCAACHMSAPGDDGAAPLFTDFTFDNLGVPRNPAIAANVDPRFFDLGLCGPDRGDLAVRGELCGAFKVPTLRNVATRRVFFHNGALHSLRDVIAFYVRRDTHPLEWYAPGADGQPAQFDDLPAQYHGNVNRQEAPYDRLPGMAPALDENEIGDMVRFLETLTDADAVNASRR